jgi:hypothetical protein
LPLMASCVAPRAAAPAPVAPRPAAVPRPAPPAVPIADRYAGDWSVADLGPGEWRYGREGNAGVARYGLGNEAVAVVLRCDAGQITIARDGVVPADMPVFLNIRSSFTERRLPIRMVAATGRMLAAGLSASDPLWDQIVYSRGRFVIEATRNAPMIVPTQPEIARVVEDCRA